MRLKKKPKPGDYILVYWVDINGSVNDATEGATLATCVTGGFFTRIGFKEKTKCLFTSLTWHANAKESQQLGDYGGYDVYPLSVVKHIEIIRPAGEIRWPTLKSD